MIKFSISIVFVAISGFILWHYFALDVPVERTLTDIQGRVIEAEIIGKSDTTITIRRAGSEERFTIANKKLSRKDRAYLWRLSDAEAPPERAKFESSPPPSPPYIQGRQAEIKNLQEKIAFLNVEISSKTLNPAVEGFTREQVTKLEKEIRSLETAIERYKWQNKAD